MLQIHSLAIGAKILKSLNPIHQCLRSSSSLLTATSLCGDSIGVELSSSIGGQAKTFRGVFNNFWLRDSCMCPSCYSASTNQRLFDTTKLTSSTVFPEQIDSNESGLTVRWKDGHYSTFSSDWLLKYSLKLSIGDSTAHATCIKKISWDQKISNSPPQTDFSTVMAHNSSVLDLYQNMEMYGFCFINNVPPKKTEPTEKLIERIGKIRHTFYGGLCTISANLSKKDTAYTNEAIEPHTDGNYFHNPPGMLLFHTLEFDGIRPCYNYIVDGQKLSEVIREEKPDHFDILCKVPLFYHHSDPVYQYTNSWVPFKIDPVTGELLEFHFNNHDRLPVTKLSLDALLKVKPNGTIVDIYEAIKTLIITSQRNDLQYGMVLEPGTVLIVDNYRLMHARSSFEGKRVLLSTYMDKEDMLSRVKCIQAIDAV